MNMQKEIAQKFSDLISRNRMQHAYIFSGGSEAQKMNTALYIAQALLCPEPIAPGIPQTDCQVCRRIATEQHPDVIIIRPENGTIKVDTVRALKREFAQSGMESRVKILIIEAMDKMTTSATNSLLKFLEEPEGQTTIFLLTDSLHQLLPTIISRAQVIEFPDLPLESWLQTLMDDGIPTESAHLLAYFTQDHEQIKSLFEDNYLINLADNVWQWCKGLVMGRESAFIYVQTHLSAQKDDRYEKRVYGQQLLDLAILFFGDLLRVKNGEDTSLAYEKNREELEDLALKISYQDIAEALKQMLEGKKMMQSHVQVQSVLEKISLKLLD